MSPPSILGQVFPDFVNKFFEILAIPLIKTPLIEIHFGWGLIHFTVAFLLMWYLLKSDEENPIFTLILILALFEVFEFIISYVIPIILKETIADTFWDLVIGFAGGMLSYVIFKDR